MRSRKALLSVMSGLIGGGTAVVALYAAGALTPTREIVTISSQPEQGAAPVRVVGLANEHPETSVDFTYASSATVNSVVHIISEYQTTAYRDPLFEYLYGPQAGKAQSSGSGVILSEDGYIVTNNHVINGAQAIRVTLNDKRSFEAQVIGTDPSTDLALLKIDARNLAFVPLGNSDDVKIGEWVLAVGNPFNLTSTVTAGIVSAKARNINILQPQAGSDVMPIESFIQTDAAVNPGNSGGALVNAHGELVGINTAIASKTGSYSGYSFAIPVNIMRKVTKDLMEYGKVQRAFLGVNIMDVNQELAEKLDLKSLQGVFVARVVSGGAAALSGIKEGDVITHIGTVQVNNVAELQEQLSKFRPGDAVTVGLLRENETLSKKLLLLNADGSMELSSAESSKEPASTGSVQFQAASASELRALRLRHGVKVAQLEAGALRSAGIKEGFIITHIDKQPVTTPQEVEKLLESRTGGMLIEGVHPSGARGFYAIGL